MSDIFTTNIHTLSGRIVSDIDLKTTSNGSSYARFRMAHNYSVWDRETKNAEKMVDWYSVVAFGRPADSIARFGHKGVDVIVSGESHAKTYTSKDGEMQIGNDLVANHIQVISSKGGGSAGNQDDDNPF